MRMKALNSGLGSRSRKAWRLCDPGAKWEAEGSVYIAGCGFGITEFSFGIFQFDAVRL